MNAERLRILRAVADGRCYTNDAGRWVIEGEARPVRKDREALLNGGWIGYSYGAKGYVLTDRGRSVMRWVEQSSLTLQSSTEGER